MHHLSGHSQPSVHISLFLRPPFSLSSFSLSPRYSSALSRNSKQLPSQASHIPPSSILLHFSLSSTCTSVSSLMFQPPTLSFPYATASQCHIILFSSFPLCYILSVPFSTSLLFSSLLTPCFTFSPRFPLPFPYSFLYSSCHSSLSSSSSCCCFLVPHSITLCLFLMLQPPTDTPH